MKLSFDLEKKVKHDPAGLTGAQLTELRQLYRINSGKFIGLMKAAISDLGGREDFEGFFALMEKLSEELQDTAPFYAHSVNRMFLALNKKKKYREMSDYCYILETCGNEQMMEMLSDALRNQQITKYLSTIQIYRIKKTIYAISVRIDRKNEITVKISMEMESPDAEWLENIDNTLATPDKPHENPPGKPVKGPDSAPK